MARVVFADVLKRHVDCPEVEARGKTVREALEAVFEANPRLRGYVLDDQAALRKHMTIFVDGRLIRDRRRLADPSPRTPRSEFSRPSPAVDSSRVCGPLVPSTKGVQT